MDNVALCIRAEYARLVYGFVAADDQRPYLNGFHAEPAPEGHTGALVVATDGIRLGILRDDLGYCATTSRIWQLDKATLKACKAERGEPLFARWLVILATEQASMFRLAVVLANTAAEAAELARMHTAPKLILHLAIVKPIDAEYPEFRRVLPAEVAENDGGAHIDQANLAPFIAVSRSGPSYNGKACLGLRATGPSATVYVLTGRADFIGVVMPVRASCIEMDRAWLDRAPPLAVAV